MSEPSDSVGIAANRHEELKFRAVFFLDVLCDRFGKSDGVAGLAGRDRCGTNNRDHRVSVLDMLSLRMPEEQGFRSEYSQMLEGWQPTTGVRVPPEITAIDMLPPYLPPMAEFAR
jgi:hypothetical protein